MRRAGLATNVVEIPPERQQAKLGRHKLAVYARSARRISLSSV